MTPNAQIRVLIMAGGTGGHVFPALALAKELQQRQCDVQWLGTDRGIEAHLVPAAGIRLNKIEVGGVRGKGWLKLLQAPWQIAGSVAATVKLIRSYEPDLMVGLGGYAAGPGGVAARICRVPLIIHEQNARPGTTNKLLARVAQKVLTGFPGVFPREQHIGNPVRSEFFSTEVPQLRFAGRQGPLRLLILGGSLGAQALNEMIPKAISALALADRPDVRHQTGERHLEAAQQAYAKAEVKADVEAFIADVASAMAWADLVICRSGALTVAELCAVGCASILVPFPFAIDDHQTANAMWLVNNRAAMIYQQADLQPVMVTELLARFNRDRAQLLQMAVAARSLARPDAAAQFADICLETAHG